MMKKIFLIFLILFVPYHLHALDVPPLHGHVNDYAGILSASAAQHLESQLASFEKTDSTQIVVLTIPSLEGDSLEDFSIRTAEAWKIGQKGKDNGVILIVAKEDRKIRIEVGWGLEGRLTDLVSGRIIRNEMAPLFREGNYDGGMEQGVSSIMAVVKGEYRAAPNETNPEKRNAPPVFALFIFFLVACVFLGAISKLLGGLTGAAGLPLIASLTFPGLAGLALIVLSVIGFLVGLFLTFLFGGGGGLGRFGGGGPFWGGGFGGGSSGGSGGGFSGGGGGFGGGGASGDW
jgi:uncharacterized protein